MKKLIPLFIILLLTKPLKAQVVPGGEKYMDQYNINSVVVNEITFNVGDTITFNQGSGQNGDFVSTLLSPMTMSSEIVHLKAGYSGYKFIISKIRNIKSGLNETISLVIMLPKNKKQAENPTADMKGIPVWIDLKLALLNKEVI